MKTKLFILAFAMVFASCATTSLSTKTTKYEVISANARGFNRNNKATSYDAIIKIGKVCYNAVLDNNLSIIKIDNVIDFKSTEKTLEN